METTIDSVQLEIQANASSASVSLRKLANSLENLQSKLQKPLNALNKFNTALEKLIFFDISSFVIISAD